MPATITVDGIKYERVEGTSRREQAHAQRVYEKRLRVLSTSMLVEMGNVLDPAEQTGGVRMLPLARRRWREVMEDFRPRFENALTTEIAKQYNVEIAKQFDPVDVTMLAHMEIGNLIREIDNTQLNAVREHLARSFNTGVTERTLSQISGVTGLTSRQVRAVHNARAWALKEGMSERAAATHAKSVQRRLLRTRAQTIGRTESTRYIGQVTQARGEALGTQTLKQWLSARDGEEDQLGICRGLDDGQKIPIGSTFAGGFAYPPAHIGCRCLIEIFRRVAAPPPPPPPPRPRPRLVKPAEPEVTSSGMRKGSAAQANEFVKDSQIKQDVYHGTESAEKVRAGGVRPAIDEARSYPGISVAQRRAYAEEYIGDTGEVLKFKLDARNPITFDELERRATAAGIDFDDWDAWAHRQGYDAVVSPGEIRVFDARKLFLIEKEAPAVRVPVKPKPPPKPKFVPEAMPEAGKLQTDLRLLKRKQNAETASLQAEIRQLDADVRSLSTGSYTEAEYRVLKRKRRDLAKLRERRFRIKAQHTQENVELLAPKETVTIDRTVRGFKGPGGQRVVDEMNDGIDHFQSMVSNRWLTRGKPKAKVLRQGSGRAHYKEATKGAYLNETDDAGTVVHELGHWLEYREKKIHNAALRFLENRTKGEQARRLRDITGNLGYDDWEVAKIDNFMKPYMGKIYPGQRATEIVSMGLEQMVRDPSKFMLRDSEYFWFIMRIMYGDL